MNLSDALGIPKDITPSHQVIITDLEKTIQTFIKTVYKKRLAEIKLKFKRSEDIKDKREITLDIQYSDVYAYHSLWSLDGFGDKLLDIPDRTIPELKSAVLKLLAIPGEDHDIPVHLVDINPKKRIRDIREADLGRMIAIEGICKKMSPVRPRIKTAVFRCHRGHIFSIPQQYGYFKQPPVCQEQGCTSRQLEHQERHSDYINSQVLTVQESPEGLIGGQQPESLRVDITNELCGLVVAGDRVVINGVVRTHPKSIRGGASSTFEIYIEAHSIERLEADYSQLEIYEEDEQRIQELAKDPDIHALLAASISPDIWGHLDVKSAIAFQLFGGVSKTEVKETTSEENPDNKIKVVTHTRGDIHILLIGDPGMAKSKMIRYVAQLAPRSVYTTGLSSSKAGLCVSSKSNIYVNGVITQIGNFVENYFNGVDVDKETSIAIDGIAQYHNENIITHVWKIPSPNNMIRVRCQYGSICVTEETKLLTSCGWMPANQIRVGDMVKISYGDGDWDESEVFLSKYYPDNVKIKNRSSIYNSLKLKFNSLDKDALKLGLDDLKPWYWKDNNRRGAMAFGDLRKICGLYNVTEEDFITEDIICQIRAGSYFKLPYKLTPELAYFVGLIAGDGSIYQKPGHPDSKTIVFSNGDLINEYSLLINKLFDKNVGVTKSCERRGTSNRFGNIAIFDLLHSLGIGSGFNEGLTIPDEIISRKHLLIPYLRGLYDTDGSVYTRRNNGKNNSRAAIEITTIYKEFAIQIQSSLMRLGIVSSIVSKDSKTAIRNDGYKIKSKKHYRVQIAQKSSIYNFYTTIGFALKRKQDILKKICSDFKDLSHPEDLFSPVVSVESISPHDPYVYDLTIKNTHNFIANGFFVHNTAAAVKDDDGQWTLEAGALVLADGGVCIVDEFDKMEKNDRESVNEALEQQTLSFAKAGITATLSTRCALLAAANPKFSRFDDTVDLGEQVNLPPALLTRFDIIFILQDIPDRTNDDEIARQILSNHTKKEDPYPARISPILFMKYVGYAKQIEPILTEAAGKKLSEYYVDLRAKAATSRQMPVPVTARYLEGLIRLAQASARMRLAKQVTLQDALRAIETMDAWLRVLAYDAQTNTWDVDVIETGKKKKTRDMERVIMDSYYQFAGKTLDITREMVIGHVVDTTKWDRGTVSDRLEMMIRSGTFFLPDGVHIREA